MVSKGEGIKEQVSSIPVAHPSLSAWSSSEQWGMGRGKGKKGVGHRWQRGEERWVRELDRDLKRGRRGCEKGR